VRWYDRLRRSSEIAFVRRRGKPAGTGGLVAYGLADRTGRTRVAVTVATTVGGAVTRNLVKRRIRGALDALNPPVVPLRLVIVAKPAAATLPYDRLAKDVASALGRLGAAP
jgi:ribonuclease P protein component